MAAIRVLEKNDIVQILAFPLAKNEPAWSQKNLEDVLTGVSDGGYLAYVGVDDSTSAVVSYAVANYIFDQGDVQNVVVHPLFRGKSLGRKLLQTLISGLVDQGVKTLFLEVRHSNTVAINLYQSMGFKCIQKRRDYYPGVDGVREDAWVFSLACL